MRADSAALFICLALLTSYGCASTRIANMDERGGFSKDADEARLWKRADEFREVLFKSGYLYDDARLHRYINDLLHKIAGRIEDANNVRLTAHIVRDPFFNAFCLPNGDIFVHTAILAEADNEAQLAALLGHEATHFLNRHILKEYRSLLNKSAFLSVFQVSTTGLGPAGSLAQLIGEFGVIGAFYGYSRDVEREADRNALNLLTANGYCAVEAQRFFEKLYAATKDDNNKLPYFYSSHPRARERIDNVKAFIRDRKMAAVPAGEDTGYRSLTRALLLDNAELSVKANKLTLAKEQAEKYDRLWPGEARPAWIRGRAFLAEGNKTEALAAFTESARRDPGFADAQRDIGFIHYKEGRSDSARAAFQEYLRLKPDAPDAAYIKEYLK